MSGNRTLEETEIRSFLPTDGTTFVWVGFVVFVLCSFVVFLTPLGGQGDK